MAAAIPALGRHCAMTFSLVSEAAGISKQMEVALAPIADRLDPQRGFQFPMRVVVVKRVERAGALQKSETARVEIGKGRDLQRLAVGDGAPQPFAAAGQNLQSGRLVDRGADIVGAAMVEAAEEVGARPWRPNPSLSTATRAISVVSVSMMVVSSGTQRKAKRAGNARRIEQRMNGQSIRGRIGLFDPELAEKRKFLARFVAAPNRETASRDAERLAVRPRAVEARALENRHILEALLVATLRTRKPEKPRSPRTAGGCSLPKSKSAAS